MERAAALGAALRARDLAGSILTEFVLVRSEGGKWSTGDWVSTK